MLSTIGLLGSRIIVPVRIAVPQRWSFSGKGELSQRTKKRRFDLKLPAYQCQKILGVGKGTLTDWDAANTNRARRIRKRSSGSWRHNRLSRTQRARAQTLSKTHAHRWPR